MNGKIDKKGNLYIKRANSDMIRQVCPYCSDESSCGEWCPLFGEASPSRWMGSPDPDSKDRKSNPKHWDLEICDRRTLFFDSFTDERQKEKA